MARVTGNVRLLQRLDRWAGVPACLVLTGWRRLVDLVRTPPPRDPQRIVFIKLAEQGSTVLARDAISRAVARVGRDHVYFLVFEENRFILDALDLIPRDNVLTVRTASPIALLASGLARLLEIRRRRIDTCVDLEFLTRLSAVIAYLTGCRRRVGLHGFFNDGPYRGDLFTHRVLYNPHLHTSRLFTLLVMAIDADPRAFPTFDLVPPDTPPLPRFTPGAGEHTGVRAILDALGVRRGDRLVLLNPNASDQLPLRRWASDNYVELAQRLVARDPDVAVAFTGAPGEAAAADALARRVGSARCVSMAGRTTLGQLLVLYDLADVLVTNDSGPGHFSALTGVDAIVLFGPETPALFAALGDRTHPLWAGIACSPCVNAYNNRQTSCRDNRCMQAITVDDVFALTTRILDARRAAASSAS
ncbi:MAG: glycosyltransferase family 9 protein [Acidobacteria bacterium]|nr:glycosyltransferase family 9 protein [Acidobacteriota bacterium]